MNAGAFIFNGSPIKNLLLSFSLFSVNINLEVKKMKSVKKFLAGIAVLAISGFGAFAQENDFVGNIMGGLDGVYEREAYETEASDPEYAYQIVELLVDQIGVGEVTKLYSFDESTDDEEDLQLISDIKKYVTDNYKVKNNQGYSFVVFRSVGDAGIDGYLAFYHYNKKASPKDLYYFYYFCIEY